MKEINPKFRIVLHAIETTPARLLIPSLAKERALALLAPSHPKFWSSLICFVNLDSSLKIRAIARSPGKYFINFLRQRQSRSYPKWLRPRIKITPEIARELLSTLKKIEDENDDEKHL